MPRKPAESKAVIPAAPAQRVLHGPGTGRRSASARRRGVKTSVSVALNVIRDIVAQRLRPGDKLPLESELLKHYAVSRASLREGMRLLEVQGLLSIRPGPGGVVVGDADPASLGRTLTLHMHFVGATYDELMETCIWSEGMLAQLAAKNRDRKKVRRLMTPFIDAAAPPESGHAPPHTVDEGLEFHRAVGELVTNRVQGFLLMMPGQILVDHVFANLDRQFLEEPFVDDHVAIARAIIAGNAAKAGQLMHDHYRRLNSYFRAYWPSTVADKIQGL